MSPVQADPDWYIARHGKRPVAYLAELGAVGSNTIFTHGVHFDDAESICWRGPGPISRIARPAH